MQYAKNLKKLAGHENAYYRKENFFEYCFYNYMAFKFENFDVHKISKFGPSVFKLKNV